VDDGIGKRDRHVRARLHSATFGLGLFHVSSTHLCLTSEDAADRKHDVARLGALAELRGEVVGHEHHDEQSPAWSRSAAAALITTSRSRPSGVYREAWAPGRGQLLYAPDSERHGRRCVRPVQARQLPTRALDGEHLERRVHGQRERKLGELPCTRQGPCTRHGEHLVRRHIRTRRRRWPNPSA
jgi:hypothetical protein